MTLNELIQELSKYKDTDGDTIVYLEETRGSPVDQVFKYNNLIYIM